MDENEKPRRVNRRSRRQPVVVDVKPPEDVSTEELDAARDPNREAKVQNEKRSDEFLKRLQFHHRHGYGSYDKAPDAKS